MKKNTPSDQDIEIPLWRIKYVLKPESILRFSWEIFIAILLLFFGFLVPYQSAFDTTDETLSLSLSLISLILFSIDIIFNLNTGFYNEGKLVVDRLQILKNYSKFWLWVDIISTIPFDWLIPQNKSQNPKFFSFFKFELSFFSVKFAAIS